MREMRRLIGTNVFAPHVAQLAPAGYLYVRWDTRYCPGRVLCGPYTDTTTTVCLLLDDDGLWFREMVLRAGGTCSEEQSEVLDDNTCV